MGAITSSTLKSKTAKDIAKAADDWFGRRDGKARWIDIPLGKTGTWWAASYEKIRDLIPKQERKIADRYRDGLKDWLDTWSKDPQMNYGFVEMVDGIKKHFGELIKTINAATLGARPGANQKDVDNFRSAGFSVLMALSAGFESVQRKEDFDLTLKKTELATKADGAYERWGDPPPEFRIDRNEKSADYWSAKKVAGEDPEAQAQIAEDLEKLEDPAQKKEWPAALKRLATNLEVVTAKDKEHTREVAGMLVVEAVRRPLGCLRDGAEQPSSPGPVTSKEVTLTDAANLRRLAYDHWEKEPKGPEENR